MNKKRIAEFEKRLKDIEYLLKSNEEGYAIASRNCNPPVDEPRYYQAYMQTRTKYLDELRVLEIEIQLEKSKKKFWIF